MADDDGRSLDAIERMNREFESYVPHNRALGLQVVSLAKGEARIRLPYDPQLVGNPDTNVLHGGVITALLDACSGLAVFMSLDNATPIATLDLRIDYLKPAPPGHDVIAYAVCYKLTRSVAFARSTAFHDSEDRPIASSAATFMLGTPMRRTDEAAR
jgi:uncharacterized protein (TIGR00369 family)